MPIKIEISCDECGGDCDSYSHTSAHSCLYDTIDEIFAPSHSDTKVLCGGCFKDHRSALEALEASEYASEVAYLDKCFKRDSGCY